MAIAKSLTLMCGIKRRRDAALVWDREIDVSAIGVAANDGAVTLTGQNRTTLETCCLSAPQRESAARRPWPMISKCDSSQTDPERHAHDVVRSSSCAARCR